jgi:hypothetical protein
MHLIASGPDRFSHLIMLLQDPALLRITSGTILHLNKTVCI